MITILNGQNFDKKYWLGSIYYQMYRKEVKLTREDEIFKQLNKGNREYLDELVRLYYPEIFRYCCWHTSSRSNAEDATQETFLKAVRYLEHYTHKGKFRAFLYKIAANTCIDLSRKKHEEPVEDTRLKSVLAEEDELGRAEAEADFMELVKTLPQELGEIVFLRFGQEMKLREIAAITGLGLRTVQSRLRGALRQLQAKLANEASERNDFIGDRLKGGIIRKERKDHEG